MFEAIESEYLVPFDGTFSIEETVTRPPQGAPGKKESKEQLEGILDEIKDLQRMLYAQDKYALLLIFQAMDAAGKDGTIRAVMSGVNPVGIQVFSFKVPTPEEIDHDLFELVRINPDHHRMLGKVDMESDSMNPELLSKKGIYPGIKVDAGAKDLAGFAGARSDNR